MRHAHPARNEFLLQRTAKHTRLNQHDDLDPAGNKGRGGSVISSSKLETDTSKPTFQFRVSLRQMAQITRPLPRPLNDPTPNAAFRTHSKPVSPPEFWLSTVLCLGPVSTGKAECGVSQGLTTERAGAAMKGRPATPWR
jgi:hypothetical protein